MLKKSPKISVIVCTHERPGLLKSCLTSLIDQNLDTEFYEILVINNSSKELNKDVSASNIIYIDEPNIGLSIARNTGLNHAKAPWVAYIDDDAKAAKNWLSRGLFNIEHFDFACFGGIYIPWYETEKPNWLPDDFGSKPILRDNTGTIKKGYNWGSNIFFNASALNSIGGFPEHLGMVGQKIGYAEESWVQKKMRDEGFTIGFDPDLKIYHLVPNRKMTLSWQIRSSFAQGRDQKDAFPSHFTLIRQTKEVFKHFFVSPLRVLFCWITRRDYTLKHAVYHTGTNIAKVIGRFFA